MKISLKPDSLCPAPGVREAKIKRAVMSSLELVSFGYRANSSQSAMRGDALFKSGFHHTINNDTFEDSKIRV